MRKSFTPFLIAAILLASYAFGEGFSEANVFEWWDDGIVTAEEAEELLALLEEGNTEEVCILAESYAQITCITPNVSTQNLEITPHGYIQWKGHMDSTGHLVNHYEKLQLSFYRYTLQLGSHNMLSYKAKNYEAYFGKISTNELHSIIPTDTLWGSAFRFPLGNFRLGALLDTSLNMQGHISYILSKGVHVDAMLWKSTENKSGTLQFTLPGFKMSTWFQPNETIPLIKIQSSERASKKAIQKNESIFSYTRSTNIYVHGNTVPEHAKLSSSILKNKLWFTQSFTFASLNKYNIKFGSNIRANMPLNADTLNNRIQVNAGMGPEIFNAGLIVSCTDISDNCSQSSLKLSASSNFEIEKQTLQMNGSAKIQSSKQKEFSESVKEPRIETSIAYLDINAGKAKFSVIFPKAKPNEFTLRGEFGLGSKYFESNFIAEFVKKEIGKIHPNKAFLQAKLNF